MASTIEQLLDKLDRSRERLLVALDELPDEALLEPNTVGNWSVADLLVQQTAWESELVTGLLRISQGKKPGRLLAALKHDEEYGRLRYEENKGRDLDRIFDDLPQVRIQVEEWLEEFSEKQLSKKGHFSWLKNRTLADLIAQLTYEHELRYLPQVEALAQKWQAPPASMTISLTPKNESTDFIHEDEPDDSFAN
ncbi:DinB family protein [Candidatus Leptofilum sp.]|uniref:DinB family protein n=1 Tax=Candidatus Leptofilum sp. TaxID=3241576 RepID=UPI003B5BA329